MAASADPFAALLGEPDWAAEGGVSLVDAMDWLLRAKPRIKSDETRRGYRRAAAEFARFLGEHEVPAMVRSMTPTALTAYAADLREREARDPRHPYAGERMSEATLGNLLRPLKTLGIALERHGVIEVSPFRRTLEPLVPDTPAGFNGLKAASPADAARLLDASSGEGLLDLRDHALVRITIDGGFRRGELARMGLADLRWDEHAIHVPHPKNDRARDVVLGPEAWAALVAYLVGGRPQLASGHAAKGRIDAGSLFLADPHGRKHRTNQL